jgi:hypothetical protein
MPAYEELYKVGTKVRIVDRSKLDAFSRPTWRFHTPVAPEQLPYADAEAEVAKVGYYFGGDILYELKDLPGMWHEDCLLPA